MPFRQFIIKVHGRCNLACDYCYVYEMADQRWRHRPAVMSEETVDCLVERVREHVLAHRLPEVDLVLHGGEPLLAGPELITRLVRAARDRIPCRTRFAVQTNGVLLDERFLRLFLELNIRVGVSIDGTKSGHDRHRKHPTGRGSHAAVSSAVDALASPRFREIFAGLLCVIDLAEDPVATFRALAGWRPPVVDFLLPHGSWSAPPPGRLPGSAETPYADWMIAVFDEWYGTPGATTSVRQLGEIAALWLGGASRVEGLGLLPSPQVVVETDGSIERSDILAAVDPVAAATGLSVATDPFDAAVAAPPPLCATCLACPVLAACGGGLPAHRHRAGSGFDNPSVYCPDLFRLTAHVRARLARDLAALR